MDRGRFLFMTDARPIYFLARKQADGKYCIFNVDVFGIGAPTAALNPDNIQARTGSITPEWLAAAVGRHTKLRAENGYVPPAHIYHNEDGTNNNRAKVGYLTEMRQGRGGNAAQEMNLSNKVALIARDNDPNKIYVNLRDVEPDAFQLIKDKKLPYRSVEILDMSVPDISSLALMFSTPPFFALRPLCVILDESVVEPAFDFQPQLAMAATHFSVKRGNFYTVTNEGTQMLTKNFTALFGKLRATKLCKSPSSMLKAAKLVLAAEGKKYEEDELNVALAADEAMTDEERQKKMAAEELEENEKKKKLAAEGVEQGSGPTAVTHAPTGKEQGAGGASVPDVTAGKEQGAGSTVVTHPAEKDFGKKTSSQLLEAKDEKAGEPAVKMEAPDPSLEHEKKETPAVEKMEHETGQEMSKMEGNEKPAAPDASKEPAPIAGKMPEAPIAPAAPAQPSAAPAATPALPAGPTGAAPTAQPTGAAPLDLMKLVSEAVSNSIEQALAPIISDLRGMLSLGEQKGAPTGTDPLAPFAQMKAKLQAKISEQLKAKVAPATQTLEEPNTKFEARIAELETQIAKERRLNAFKARISKAIEESGGLLRLDVEGIAQFAADLPVTEQKVVGKDKQVLTHKVDMGAKHIDQILQQAGVDLPPPPLGYAAEGGTRAQADEDIEIYRGNKEAFEHARFAANDWDTSPQLQKAQKNRGKYISSEVYYHTRYDPSAKAGSNGRMVRS